MEYDWPGNIRELKNIIERSVILQKGDVMRPSELLGKAASAAPNSENKGGDEAIAPLSEMERNYIKHALERLSGNYTRAAKALGISLSTLKRKIKEYGLK
ncbi:MAG: helix-turn-helix domain-containing protein [Nitrospirota bacterium]